VSRVQIVADATSGTQIRPPQGTPHTATHIRHRAHARRVTVLATS